MQFAIDPPAAVRRLISALRCCLGSVAPWATRRFGGAILGASTVVAAHAAADITWFNLADEVAVEGKAWENTRGRFDRLPAKAEGVVRPEVWKLGQDSAGLRLRFVTNAESLHARWTLRRADRLALTHMPATGVSGLDLYVRDGGTWRWLAVARPENTGENQRILFQGLARERREYMLYLPLYNGIEMIHVGIPDGAVLEAAPARDQSRPPIAFYGTSIVQGGGASRSGMAYPAILGRKLDWPTINLGFSGNGKMEPEVAGLLAEIEPAAYVIDSLPNLTAEEAQERVEPFLRKLRERRPTTPILLVENIHYGDAAFNEARRLRSEAVNRSLRGVYNRLREEGDKHLHYITSAMLLRGDGEDTVDGTHPTDLGFAGMANGIEPFLREALASGGFTVPDEEGFESLFDGRTLSDWKRHDGMPPIHRGAKWWVEDGVIQGMQDPPGTGGLLWLDRSFQDFVLKLEIQLTYPMDTGVFLRVAPNGLSHQVCIDYRPGSDIGAIFIPFVGHRYVSRFADGARLVNEGGWDKFEIRMEGEPARIRVWMNSRLLTDFRHTPATTRGLPPRGGLAFQVHPDVEGITAWGAGNVVRFRNIRIKELERGATSASSSAAR